MAAHKDWRSVLLNPTPISPADGYMVVPNESEAERTIKEAIEELAQLNERQEYTYSREELIVMLDEALD